MERPIIITDGNSGTVAVVAAATDDRIVESGEKRITMTGDQRVTS